MNTRVISGWLGLGVIAVLVVVDLILVSAVVGGNGQQLKVTFLDVGQGDGTLIETPSGRQVLIDGGRPRSVNRALSEQLPFYDRRLDVVIATHADADHIGGLVEVLSDFKVDYIVPPIQPSDTPDYTAFQKAAAYEVTKSSAAIKELTRGDLLHLGDGVYLLGLFPFSEHGPTGTNESSLVLKLIYGDTGFVFTADSPQAIEEYLTETDGKLLAADVLKIGHHGSDTSSSDIFISAVSPGIGVVSAGADNSYGHPDPAVLDRLENQEVEVLCTCDLGSVTLISDGKEVRQEK